MFYRDEEDVGRAHVVAERKFGRRGRYAPRTINGMINAFIGTREYGTIWYGDIENVNDILPTINELSREIGQRIYLMTTPFGFDDAVIVSG
jgi:hypothetical protein